MIPITRKELYLNKIVGNDNYSVPEKPITEEEFFFAEILGEAVQAPEPLTRYQMYLAKIAKRDIEIPYPQTRLEFFLAKAAGMDITVPVPITREEIYWSNYTVIVEFEVENTPPLTYKAIEGTLENYRIYGDTVDGESVGDRTGNLFDGFIQGIRLNTLTGFEEKNNTSYTSGFIGVENDNLYSYSGGSDTTSIALLAYDSSKNYIGRSTNTIRTDTIIYTSTTFSNYTSFSIDLTGNTNPIAYIRITHVKAEQTVIDDEQIMLNEGSTALPYEPYGYKVPVTVSNGTDAQTIPIYLSEQIRKVGDEAEYIDYEEQKQHRVRKNLLPNTATSQTINGVTFTVNNDGSVTCNGTARGFAVVYLGGRRSTVVHPTGNEYSLSKGTYKLTGCPINGTGNTFYQEVYSSSINLTRDYGDGTEFNVTTNDIISVRLVIFSGYTCNNLIFYPMIRKADIEDDTYEPYIEDTELNVTLPALPTLSGTNTLSVGTEVQPSKVYIKGEKEREYT